MIFSSLGRNFVCKFMIFSWLATGDSIEDLPGERSVSRELRDQTVTGASLNESSQPIRGSFIPSDSTLSNSVLIIKAYLYRCLKAMFKEKHTLMRFVFC
jgi:hypothetical protein